MIKTRTKFCGEFDNSDIGKIVIANGWVAKRRDFGGLVFVDLRDRKGVVQVVFNESNLTHEQMELVSSIRSEFVLSVEGEVVNREQETINEKLKTGYIEIVAKNIMVLSKSHVLPFAIDDEAKVGDSIKLKHRYLDLRRGTMQRNIALRSQVTKIIRDYLHENDFLEIETPILGKSTPEGARDYLVPSRTFPGSFFALPQSPQLYKQLLMVSGFDKYYQIARCFRDEDLRADRQPEFTQVDIESSFIEEPAQIKTMLEPLIKRVFSETINVELQTPFKVLSYEDAMNRFGSDKPDTRFGLEIKDVSHIAKNSSLSVFSDIVEGGGSVRVINGKGLNPHLARRDLDKLVDFVKEFGAKGLSYINFTEEGVKSPLLKFFSDEQQQELFSLTGAETNDILFFIADKNNELVLEILGRLRLHLAEKFNLIDKSQYDVLWVTDFPLFEYSAEEKRYVAKHHPFTSPKNEDISLLESSPEKVRAKAYDLVVNGYEVGGGSIRIHDQNLQQRMFKALGFSEQDIEEQFGFFVNAFKYGAPPHGGIALGLDRLIMLLVGTTDIKQVIAFPKIQTAMDVMTLAPSEVAPKQLQELSITVEKPEKSNQN